MRCSNCDTTLNQAVKFCPECGNRTGRKCPECSEVVPLGNKYCCECGANLSPSPGRTSIPGGHHETAEDGSGEPEIDTPLLVNRGERRHVTVYFSDMSNYTALSESHDPEDVKQFLAKVIESGRKIINAYGGHVERVIGDEILAVFGLPKVHEDDAVRAINAAREHHDAVIRLGKRWKEFSDQPISMHTGINSGLVVIDNSSPQDGIYEISGDTVNLASRLADMAGPNEILVGQEAYRQAHGYFGFDRKPAAHIKGKTETIKIYAVTKSMPRPSTLRRSVGLRAPLIGRKAEFSQLHDAVARLKINKGSIFAFIGEAGTGKSRLVYEFQKAYEKEDFQWITGNAYAYTQGVAYFPLINLLQPIYGIEDTQSVVEVRSRIKKVTLELLGDTMDEIPILENLYGLENKATQSMSPQIWQQRLAHTIAGVISAVARSKPTIFCMEDLHWTDTPSISLLRKIVMDFQPSAILICTFRPQFSFFAGHELHNMSSLYHEIRLGELSYSEAQDLVVALLDTGTIPLDLMRLIRDRAEGNPFYLEELINTLVESEVLVCNHGMWSLTRELQESDIPSTIHGVITARLDRLSQPAKRVLQEASVIGRVFLIKLLQRVSIYNSQLEEILAELEQSGLISVRSHYPEREMMFKHALIQEVCYSNLLRAERQRVHARIGKAMETLFADRLNEFYETMALHFKRGQALEKAVFYLIESGNKALKRYALEESQRHFQAAKQLAELVTPPTKASQALLVDVLSQWGFVYYYRGRFREALDLFDAYRPMIEGLADPVRQGMFWAWHGWILWHRGKFETAYQELRKAHALGEKAKAYNLVSHAANWLAWTCPDTGRLDEAVEYADQAIALFESGQIRDSYIYFNSLASKGYACWHRGEKERTCRIGNRLLEFGMQNGNVRSLVMGHCCIGWSHLIRGDLEQAKSCFEESVRVSADPWYSKFPKLALGLGYAAADVGEAALPLLQELIDFSTSYGAEFIGSTANFFRTLCLLEPSNAPEKIQYLERQLDDWHKHNGWLRYVICAQLSGHKFLDLVRKIADDNNSSQPDLEARILNRVEELYQHCIEETREKGAKSLHALSYLGLGEYYAVIKQPGEAKQNISKAIELFEQCDADIYLLQAQAFLERIEKMTLELPDA